MIVRTILTGIFAAIALFYVLRHNMHMFQLNTYMIGEQVNWIKKNARQQWLLAWGALLGIVRLFWANVTVDVVIWLTLYLTFLEYRAIMRLNKKTPLVYTARVKRMITTIMIITAAGVALGVWLGGLECLSGVFIILVAAQIGLNMTACFINKPMEKAVNNYYLNDAKRLLRSVPDMKIIGVTGSYGKTSMKYFLQTLLQAKFNVLVTPGNFNTPLGITRTVRGQLKPTHEIFICEMGARYVGEIKEDCDLAHPDWGVITSIGPQHLETFGGMENVQKTKFELADALPDGGKLFLNGDNEYITDYIAKKGEYPNTTYYHNHTDGEGYKATVIKLSQFGTEFDVVGPDGEKESFRMKLVGEHNVINVVGAISVACSLGMTLKELKLPVRRLQPVEHRMQLTDHGDHTIIDDAYNSNPVGSKAAVETLALFDGIKILITPGMVELGAEEDEYNYKFGTYAAACCDYILLVGKKHTEPIMAGALSQGFPEKKCIAFDYIEEALAYAHGIKGEGHKYILLENDLPDNY